MVNKEKLLLLATIYMLVPGAMSDALAESSQPSKPKSKKAHTVEAVKKSAGAVLNERS